MANFQADLDDGGDPISKTIAALSGRKLLLNQEETKVHPFRSIPTNSIRFSRTLDEFLETLEMSEAKHAQSSESEKDQISIVFEALCYRAAELFEVFEDLPNIINFQPDKSFKERKMTYRAAIKKNTNDWKRLCNFIKHNSNSIVPIRFVFDPSKITVSGFALCEPKPGAALALNTKFHKNKEKRRSFNISIQQMIYSLMRCDYLAAEMIKSLPNQDCESLPEHGSTFKLASSLNRIASRPEHALPTQPSMFYGISQTSSGLLLHRKQAIHIPGDAIVTNRFTADGFTRTVPLV